MNPAHLPHAPSIRLLRSMLAVAVVIGAFFSSSAAQEPRWPSPIANEVVPYHTGGLTHGPMLGRPTNDQMRVWIRTAEPTAFRVLHGTSLPLDAESAAIAGETTEGADNTGFVDLARLRPNTRYFYAVEIDGQLPDLRADFSDPWPSFRTLPDRTSYADEANNPKGLFNICFSVGCCASQDPTRSGGHYASPPSFKTLLDRHGDEVMFHLMNGDTIYEEMRDGTLDGVRDNYKLYLSRGRSFANLLRRIPSLFLYDDHEIGWDIHGAGEVGLRDGRHLIRDIGLRAWSEYCGWADYASPRQTPIRFGEARLTKGSDLLVDEDADFRDLDSRQVSTIHLGPWTTGGQAPPRKRPHAGVYDLVEVVDQHRLRVRPAFKTDGTIDYSIGTHHWFDWKVGNCHYFALDSRGERSRPNGKDTRDPSRYVLGDEQLEWLTKGVASTDADFIFIISPDPWMVYHTGAHVGGSLTPKGDGYASFVHERDRLLDHFDQVDKPILIFTGDVHNSLAVQISDNVWEFMCGPMASTAHPRNTAGDPPLGGWWESQGRHVKVKWIAGFPNNMPYQRLRNTYYTVVQVNNIMTSGRPQGTGHQYTAYQHPQVVVRFHDGYTGNLHYAEAISPLDLVDRKDNTVTSK
ncbi:PhoD-like phosphatase [Planctomycetes bacterium Pan216]|uniref:PhoD-like phosphatase n=1 Tax=Kolteria novifilia TaxID=2527975 RepID=A0A518AXD2_9BACT|nr:PhoD-like phosphatase [Planctomycetes bacterium Pan216]